MSRSHVFLKDRQKSFKKWPKDKKHMDQAKVEVLKEQLAEAGFYFTGEADHVRCFFCGNGLKEWESHHVPWEDHALFFPDCHFLRLKKGKDFSKEMERKHFLNKEEKLAEFRDEVERRRMEPMTFDDEAEGTNCCGCLGRNKVTSISRLTSSSS